MLHAAHKQQGRHPRLIHCALRPANPDLPPDPSATCPARPVCFRPLQAWINTPRNKGGLGGCSYPLLADLTKQVAKDYEVLIEEGGDAGVALR